MFKVFLTVFAFVDHVDFFLDGDVPNCMNLKDGTITICRSNRHRRRALLCVDVGSAWAKSFLYR